jgi:hypothetical protein
MEGGRMEGGRMEGGRMEGGRMEKKMVTITPTQRRYFAEKTTPQTRTIVQERQIIRPSNEKVIIRPNRQEVEYVTSTGNKPSFASTSVRYGELTEPVLSDEDEEELTSNRFVGSAPIRTQPAVYRSQNNVVYSTR